VRRGHFHNHSPPPRPPARRFRPSPSISLACASLPLVPPMLKDPDPHLFHMTPAGAAIRCPCFCHQYAPAAGARAGGLRAGRAAGCCGRAASLYAQVTCDSRRLSGHHARICVLHTFPRGMHVVCGSDRACAPWHYVGAAHLNTHTWSPRAEWSELGRAPGRTIILFCNGFRPREHSRLCP